MASWRGSRVTHCLKTGISTSSKLKSRSKYLHNLPFRGYHFTSIDWASTPERQIPFQTALHPSLFYIDCANHKISDSSITKRISAHGIRTFWQLQLGHGTRPSGNEFLRDTKTKLTPIQSDDNVGQNF